MSEDISKVVLEVWNKEGEKVHIHNITGKKANNDRERIMFTLDVKSAMSQLRQKYPEHEGFEIKAGEKINYHPLEISSTHVTY